VLEPHCLIYARPEKAHLHSIDIPYSTRASREIISKADSAADGTFIWATKQGIQFRLEYALSQIKDVIITGFRLRSAVGKRCQSRKFLEENGENQKWVLHTFNTSILSMFNLNTGISSVLYVWFYLYPLLWGLYVMQIYISLLILLLVNHAWQVLNNNWCGLLLTSGCWWRQLCSMVWFHMYHIKGWRFSL